MKDKLKIMGIILLLGCSYYGFNHYVLTELKVSPTSIREMLSVPFQQTGCAGSLRSLRCWLERKCPSGSWRWAPLRFRRNRTHPHWSKCPGRFRLRRCRQSRDTPQVLQTRQHCRWRCWRGSDTPLLFPAWPFCRSRSP